MTDILAGATIKAVDRPAAVYTLDTTLQNDVTPDTYVTGTPVVDVTFTAPTSGRVKLTVGGASRSVSGGARALIVPEVYEGTSAAGTLILEAIGDIDLIHGFVNPHSATDFLLGSRVSFLSGLTPGATHYARIMYKVSPTAAVADIGARDLGVVPLT